MKRGGPLRRKTPLRSRSRIERGTARSTKDFTPAVRLALERRSGGWCEAAATPNCQRRAVHAHHRLMRSQGGLGTVQNGLLVCATCHQYIHDHPTEAYERGWLIRGLQKSA